MSGRNLTSVLADAGGVDAPRERHAQLRAALAAGLAHGRAELARPRSGGERPVEMGIAAQEGGLLAVLPVPVRVRADPDAVSPRAWRVVTAAVGALAEAGAVPPPARTEDLALRAGEDHDGFVVLALPVAEPDAELAALALDERLRRVDRLRAAVHALPAGLVRAADLREPPAPDLRTAEAVARLGGDPEDPDSVDALEEALLALVPRSAGPVSPHDEPDPSLRVARRIAQRLAGMGKWGGYHTAFDHLARGFAGNERERANAVGEALLDAGLLREKPSVGQRHVFLDPRRAAEVYALIEAGRLPPGVTLP